MKLDQRIVAFEKLGKLMTQKTDDFTKINSNPWFTPQNIEFAINALARALSGDNLHKWTAMYPMTAQNKNAKKIGVISAGNIPLVGFHDFLSVLISGHFYIGKLSSKDDKLLPLLIDMLIDIEPEFQNLIRIEKHKLQNFDAVIATGSNNSARYFEAYFGKHPHIIRHNRNSVAVLTGKESKDDLKNLCDDIFMYFGLGCRNVSKLFVPDNFNLDRLFEASANYADIINHNKYANNYDYNRAVYLMDLKPFFDNGFFMLKEDLAMISPISVVYFERYSDIETVKQRLTLEKNNLQCIVSNHKFSDDVLDFGQTQYPQLWDYADNVDTLNFLINL